MMASRYEYLSSLERQKAEPNMSRAYDLSLTASRYMEIEQRLQEKLQKLIAFNSQSAYLFDSIQPLLEAVQQGLRQVSNAWNPETKVFIIPQGKEMEWVKTIEKDWYKYDFDDGISDFSNDIRNISDWSKEAVGSFFEKTSSKVFKESKNIGKSWAANLQPRSSLGTFVKDSLKPRKWLTGKLKGISATTSKAIGQVAKWGGRGLIAFGAYEEAKDYYEKHRDVGCAISYSALATGAGYVAGTVGASIGGAIAVGLGAASTGLIATFAAPLVGAVVVGTLTSVAVKALYNNVKPFRNAVDSVGDGINKVVNAFSDSLANIKGVFSW
ncbi:hypothetical protein [Streptococcus merionis]|uniref:hypothetical protein n=1 Tax=Streptococcus merionis TaxID=400065 RepID=UPI003511B952